MRQIERLAHPPAVVRDAVLLAARVAVGVVFQAHGWQKLFINGLEDTTAGFTQLGIPLPRLSATYVAVVELLAGLALVAGFLLPAAGLLLFSVMLGAFVFVHAGNGIFLSPGGGFEFVLVLGTASLLLGFGGPGRFSFDALLAERRAGHPHAPSE